VSLSALSRPVRDPFPRDTIVQWLSYDFAPTLPVIHTGTSQGSDPTRVDHTVVTLDHTTVHDAMPRLPRAFTTEDVCVLTHLDGRVLSVPSATLTIL